MDPGCSPENRCIDVFGKPVAHYGHMRGAVLLALLVVTFGTAGAVSPRQRHPYRKHWKRETAGKPALGGVGARAGWKTARQGGGAAALGRTAGAGLATHAVKTTVEHAVAAPLHEDLHYHRSTKKGFGARMGHALASTVVTRNTRTGKRTPAVGRVSGNAAAGAVPQGALAGASGAATAGAGLGAAAGANVAREFWPRHHPKTEARAQTHPHS